MFCLMDLQVFTSYTHQREAELNQNTLLQSEIREKFLDPQISDSLEVFSGEKNCECIQNIDSALFDFRNKMVTACIKGYILWTVVSNLPDFEKKKRKKNLLHGIHINSHQNSV